MNDQKRRFGIKHPFPFVANGLVFTKRLTKESAAKADDLAESIGKVGTLGVMFTDKVKVEGPTRFSIAGFTIFYEVA